MPFSMKQSRNVRGVKYTLGKTERCERDGVISTGVVIPSFGLRAMRKLLYSRAGTAWGQPRRPLIGAGSEPCL
jgi:hypothetical protein